MTTPGDPEGLARLAREVLTLAGLPERSSSPDNPGGYRVTAWHGEVRVNWLPVSSLAEEAMDVRRHPTHPLVVFEGEVRASMERAIASVLHAAGFTVTLRPGQIDAVGLDEAGLDLVIVTAAPAIKVWTTD